MTPNDISVLKWYDTIDYQVHREVYSSGHVYQLHTPVSYLPPFDFAHAKTGASITSFELIDLDSGTTTDVTAELVAVGLAHDWSNPDYDVYRYPSHAPAALGIANGQYYAKMTDNNGDIWYSEVFTFCADVDNHIKLEWWHDEAFCYPTTVSTDGKAEVQYNSPYKNRFYIPNMIGKPSYQEKDVVSERDGKRFPIQQISWKEYKFTMVVPEYVLDTLSRIWQHDNVVITYRGKEYQVDSINFEEDWTKHGYLANVVCTFQTDTVIVNTGRAGDAQPQVQENCIVANQTCIDLIAQGGTEYTTFMYMGSPMSDGDKFMTYDGGMNLAVEVYAAGAWSTPVVGDDYVAYVTADDFYYFYHLAIVNWTEPLITSLTDSLAGGATFNNTSNEIWLKDALNNEWLAAVGTAAQFEGAGITYVRGDATHAKVKVSSALCNQFVESNWYSIDGFGIGAMIVETDNQVA